MLDCSTCNRPQPASCFGCPIDDQPFMAPRVRFLLDLWRRMQQYEGCLPDSGGLLDQDEKLMREIGWIHDRISSREAQKNLSLDNSKAPKGLLDARGKPMRGTR